MNKEQMRRFVEMWQKSKSAMRVAERMEMDIKDVRTLAFRMRRNGVALKEMAKNVVGQESKKSHSDMTKKDWKQLAELAQSFKKAKV